MLSNGDEPVPPATAGCGSAKLAAASVRVHLDVVAMLVKSTP